jgi:outer membrane protein TolC
VKQSSLELAQQTLADNKTKVDIGTLAPIEVKQTESEVANRNLQVIQSKGSVITNEDQIKKLVSCRNGSESFLVTSNDAGHAAQTRQCHDSHSGRSSTDRDGESA